MTRTLLLLPALCVALLVSEGCRRTQPDAANGTPTDDTRSGPVPVFSLAWSEYPSWSVFGVADELGIIDKDQGELGKVEKKHQVDIVLKLADYPTCLNLLSTGESDAVCVTNMDALIVSESRDCVAVMPTSTSFGADACLVTEQIQSVDDLKNHEVYGAQGTVSEYCFARALQKRGHNPSDFRFTNQDPGTAAVQMRQRAASHQAIMVWNPFVLQTLQDRSDVRVLFDSTEIRNEIVDMVVTGNDTLEKEGAKAFVAAISDAFYQVCRLLEDPDQGDAILVALGQRFSSLGLDEMKKAVEQTRFYKTPQEARQLLTSDEFRQTMKVVEQFCRDYGLVKEPSYGFGPDPGAVKLAFDHSYLPAE